MKGLKERLKSFENLKIAVFGDLMVDHYINGVVSRISPEAPIPVVDVREEKYSLGGAANVAANISSLGAEPFMFGVCGKDMAGQHLRDCLAEQKISADYLVVSENRPTTLKSRVVAGNQQVVRIDFEDKSFINNELAQEVLDRFERVASECSGVILEDYNKGFLSAFLIEGVIKIAKKHNLPVCVDPKFNNFTSYKGVTVFKPNMAEFCSLSGLTNFADFEKKAWKMVDDLQCEFLVVTKGRDGLSVFQKACEQVVDIPTFAQTVYDVCGAGDAVISSLALAIGAGADIVEASRIANHAAGVVCGRIGVVSVSRQEILNSFAEWQINTEE